MQRCCENEAASLILSAFAGRAERAGISINVQVYDRNGKLFLQVTNSCQSRIRFEHGVPVSKPFRYRMGDLFCGCPFEFQEPCRFNTFSV